MDVIKQQNSTNNEDPLVEANLSPNETSVGCPDKLASVDSGLELDPSPACSKETFQPDATVLVTFGSEKYNIPVMLNGNVADFKTKVAELSGVPENMQKLICKGVKLLEEKTLRDCGVGDNSKIMLIGSRPAEVDNVKKGGNSSDLAEIKASEVIKKEPLCRQKQHMKVLEKGIPDDAIPGIKNAQDPLPNVPISGMLNKSGGKVRLTFKLELDQVWIGTKERTEKLNMTQIKRIIYEPIEFHEEYHILGLQLGPTEQSLYFLYWVPAQYVTAIKNAITGD